MTSSVCLLRTPDAPSIPPPLRGRLCVHVRIAYLGTGADGARLVEPLRAMGPRLIDTVDEMPFTAFAAILNDPVDPVPAYERTAQLRDLPVDLVDTVLR